MNNCLSDEMIDLGIYDRQGWYNRSYLGINLYIGLKFIDGCFINMEMFYNE